MWWAPVTYPCFMVWVLSRDRNGRTNGFFDCGKDVMATNASLDVNEMWWMLLCRVIHPLGVQRLWVLARFSGALLDYAWVQKNLLSTDRTLRGMWCCVDYKVVVRAWQRRIQAGSPGMIYMLLVVDSVAVVGVSSKLGKGVWLIMDMGPSLLQTVVSFASGLSRAPQMIRDCVDGCDALSKGPVVAARQTAAVRYALFIVRGCAREGVFVSAIGFFVKWQLEVVKCLTGRERVGVDAVMPRNPPDWRSVAKGAVTSVRCLAGLWVDDFWSSKHVPYSKMLVGYTGPVEAVGTRPTSDCCCWRIEVGTLVLGRCLGLENSSCWGTNGCLMKARPCVWLDPKGGIIARALFVLVSMFSASMLWIVVLRVELEMLVVGLLRYSNNNNNNVHNVIEVNRDDAALVMSEKFKDCVLSWRIKRLQAQCTYSWYWRFSSFPAIPSDAL